MPKRAQFWVLKEIFVFLLGFFVLLGIIYVFSRIISPAIADFSVRYQVGIINSYVDYTVVKSYEFSKNSFLKNATISVDMPDSIAGYQYALNVENNTICTVTLSGIIKRTCKHLTVNATLLGGYTSGELKTMVIDSVKSDDGFTIRIRPSG